MIALYKQVVTESHLEYYVTCEHKTLKLCSTSVIKVIV